MANAAVRALGRIRHPDVIPYLIEALENSAWKATDAAVQALGELGAKEAIGPLIQCFEEMPNCPYHLVGEALRRLGSERAVDAWIAGLKKGSWWYPRAACAAELAKNKLEKGLPALQEALKDEGPEVRRAAVLALMEFRSEKTIEALREALADKDFEVRMYAKETLKKIGAGISQTRPDPFLEVREKIVRLIMDKKLPSLSLAVVKNGEIIWEEAFGLANLEKKIKATPETLYAIASSTKPFTATALMILVERGLVDLDKPAPAYLGEVKLRAFEGDASEATLRRILHHTSGLPMYWNFYYAAGSRKRPPLKTTLQRYGLLVSRPGESYNYSNLGYAVLEFIIERVSGKPYPEFLAAEVFKPLNLKRATVFTTPPESFGVAEKYASTFSPVPFCDHDTRGASAIYATAHDLALFLLLHLGRLQPAQKAILKPDSIAAMQRSRDPDVRYSSYAFGWERGRRFGYPIFTHGGAMDGCRAHLAMIPDEGLAAAVLINGETQPTIQVCDWIFAALLPEYARNLRAAPFNGGVAPPPSTFSPPPGLIGTWAGMIKTHEGDIPVRLVVEKNGSMELFRPDPAGGPGNAYSPLKTPTLNQGIFVVHFPQVFSLSDAPSSGHRTVLSMKIRDNKLSGEANLIAADMSYSLPSYIEMKREALKQ
jgi:CubicO group peptidase (beta-lactamase class C family)